MEIFTKQWFKAAGVRAIKTMAQTAVGILGASTVMTGVNWAFMGSAVLIAGLGSILTSLAGLPELKGDEENG